MLFLFLSCMVIYCHSTGFSISVFRFSYSFSWTGNIRSSKANRFVFGFPPHGDRSSKNTVLSGIPFRSFFTDFYSSQETVGIVLDPKQQTKRHNYEKSGTAPFSSLDPTHHTLNRHNCFYNPKSKWLVHTCRDQV